jgi:hypothetical protein
MNNTSPASSPDATVEQLQFDWSQLCDVDRALAVRAINQSGLSIRGIARLLQRSESSLRNLLSALDAPPADLAAARQGTISTSELVRRAKAERQRREKKAQQAAEREGERQANEGAKLICDWLEKNRVSGPDGERIINQVRDKFIQASRTGTPPPKINIPAGRSQAELIELCRPKRPIPNDVENINWYVEWLTWWVLYVFADPNVRDQALDIALERQWKR